MRKNLLVVTLFFSINTLFLSAVESSNLKLRVQEMFRNLIENPVYDETLVDKYVSSEYTQIVDGKTFHFPEFKLHLQAIKEAAIPEKIQFLHMVQENDTVCTVHHVHEVKKNGDPLITEVIAFFTFDSDQKMVLCRELTHILQGSEEDKALSSKY